ncbi:ribonuclease HII, partial [Pandoraea nosoerga]|nr:ribonuclease HII [Pandoraea nosoerga]
MSRRPPAASSGLSTRLNFELRMTIQIPSFSIERRAIAQGFVPVAGVAEAGRGPLAGPVVASAVILDPDQIPDGLADSKQLDEAAREALYVAVMTT